MSRTDGRSTADGVAVKPGLIVWDNNLDLCVVVAEHGEPSHGVQWWDMRDAMTGERSPMQDGTRMATYFGAHKFGDARKALIGRYVAAIDAGRDMPWEYDVRTPCGGCGTEWEWHVSGETLTHGEGCPVPEAWDVQTAAVVRREAVEAARLAVPE